MLIVIKILHTVIWAVLAGAILALPRLGVARQFRRAALVSAIVLVECAVIAINGGRCPLTDWAARFTANRHPNFDIYLPVWLAQYNKLIFGSLFVLGEAVVVGSWLSQLRRGGHQYQREQAEGLAIFKTRSGRDTGDSRRRTWLPAPSLPGEREKPAPQ